MDRLAKILMEAQGSSWDAADHAARNKARNAVIVLVKALMLPTKEMAIAGGEAIENCTDSDWDSGRDGESQNSYTYLRDGSDAVILKAMLEAAIRPSLGEG